MLSTGETLVRSVILPLKVFKGTIHNPVRTHLLPVRTILSLYLTVASIILNVTLHPALHNGTTDTKEFDANPGMTCSNLAVVGNPGISRMHLWVDETWFPLGNVTCKGFSAGLLANS